MKLYNNFNELFNTNSVRCSVHNTIHQRKENTYTIEKNNPSLFCNIIYTLDDKHSYSENDDDVYNVKVVVLDNNYTDKIMRFLKDKQYKPQNLKDDTIDFGDEYMFLDEIYGLVNGLEKLANG